MANIRVKCPACKAELEIDESYEGQEVECGNCLEVFSAKRGESTPSGKTSEGDTSSRSGGGSSSRSKRKSEEETEDKPRRKKRRRDDDDDDYDHDRRRDDDDDDDDYSGPPRRRPSNINGLAIASLIMGILSVLMAVGTFPFAACCLCFGVVAMPISGLLSLGAIITGAFALRQPEGKPMAIIGLVLGGIAIALIVLQLILGMVPFMMAPKQPPQPAPPARR